MEVIFIPMVVIDAELGVHLLLKTKEIVQSGNEVLLVSEVGFSLIGIVRLRAFLIELKFIKFLSGLGIIWF